MTQGFYDLVMSLLDMADEVAANEKGYKGKPYLLLGDVNKHAFNIKKQDKKAFEEIHKRVTGNDIAFEEIIKNFQYLTNHNKNENSNYSKETA